MAKGGDVTTTTAGSGELRLRPPRNPVDPRAVSWWRTSLALLFAVPVVALVVAALLIAPAAVWLLSAAAVLVVAGTPLTLALPRWWYRLHRWEVTDAAVYTRSGYFWQEWRVAPMSRIQTVDTQRGPLEQRFGLATVTVTTASAKGALKIEGLDHEVAAELAERLTATTQATPGDAT
jgi:membrane protein YdbS with pleckstrin-like domain